VTVTVNSSGPTGGIQLALSFDATKVQVSGWTEGSFYKTWATGHGGSSLVFPQPTIDNTSGTISDIGIAIMGASAGGPTGSGDVVIYHATAASGATGTASFTLSDVVVSDQNGAAISNPTIANGQVTFGNSNGPTVTTAAASEIADTTATLNGSLTSLGSATSVQVSFDWGATTSYGTSTAAQTMTATGTFTASLTGLTAGTTYHYRAKAASGSTTVNGSDMTFATSTGTATTAPPATTANKPSTTKSATSGQTSTASPSASTGTSSTQGNSSVPYAVDISQFMGSDGKIKGNVAADGGQLLPVHIIFSSGTLAVAPDGSALMEIDISKVTATGANGSDLIVGDQFNFGPEGTTFDPAVTIELGYNPASLPKGVAPSQLRAVWLNPNTAQWVQVGGAVDSRRHVVRFQTGHFSTYAIVVPGENGSQSLAFSGDGRSTNIAWYVFGVVIIGELLIGAAAMFVMKRRRGPVLATATATAGVSGRHRAGTGEPVHLGGTPYRAEGPDQYEADSQSEPNQVEHGTRPGTIADSQLAIVDSAPGQRSQQARPAILIQSGSTRVSVSGKTRITISPLGTVKIDMDDAESKPGEEKR
jgi:hypothetical protein